jgi:hypothetical protein
VLTRIRPAIAMTTSGIIQDRRPNARSSDWNVPAHENFAPLPSPSLDTPASARTTSASATQSVTARSPGSMKTYPTIWPSSLRIMSGPMRGTTSATRPSRTGPDAPLTNASPIASGSVRKSRA